MPAIIKALRYEHLLTTLSEGAQLLDLIELELIVVGRYVYEPLYKKRHRCEASVTIRRELFSP